MSMIQNEFSLYVPLFHADYPILERMKRSNRIGAVPIGNVAAKSRPKHTRIDTLAPLISTACPEITRS